MPTSVVSDYFVTRAHKCYNNVMITTLYSEKKIEICKCDLSVKRQTTITNIVIENIILNEIMLKRLNAIRNEKDILKNVW